MKTDVAKSDGKLTIKELSNRPLNQAAKLVLRQAGEDSEDDPGTLPILQIPYAAGLEENDPRFTDLGLWLQTPANQAKALRILEDAIEPEELLNGPDALKRVAEWVMVELL